MASCTGHICSEQTEEAALVFGVEGEAEDAAGAIVGIVGTRRTEQIARVTISVGVYELMTTPAHSWTAHSIAEDREFVTLCAFVIVGAVQAMRGALLAPPETIVIPSILASAQTFGLAFDLPCCIYYAHILITESRLIVSTLKVGIIGALSAVTVALQAPPVDNVHEQLGRTHVHTS